MSLELTLKERLVLAQNYRLLALQDPENKDHWERLEEVVAQGYTGMYWMLTEHFAEQSLPEETSDYIHEVLQMWEAIGFAVEDGVYVPEDDAERHSAKFPGFDGNNEAELLGYANTFCSQERYEGLKRDGRIPNSHMPTRDWYERMLVVWRGRQDRYGRLTGAEVKALLSA